MFNKNNKELIRKKYNIIEPFSTKMPVIDGIVFNPVTKQDRGEIEKFLIDTGAELNILRGIYEDLLKINNNRIRWQKMLYLGGKSSTYLPVYKVGIEIKGYSFDSEAVIDKDREFSLLGQAFFKKSLNVVAFRDNGQHQWITSFRFFKG